MCAGCVRGSPQWASKHVTGSQKDFHSSRMLYKSKNYLSGIDLSLMDAAQETCLYLQVHGPALTTSQITLLLDGELMVFNGLCHAGGQRLSLPEEYQQKILNALLEEKTILLQIEGYMEKILPSKEFKKLRKGDSFLNFFGL
jgi:hypothetical protein